MTVLASSDFDLVVGIIVFIFWVVAALAGKLKSAMTSGPARSPNQQTPLQKLQAEIAQQIRQMQQGQAVRQPPPLPADRRQPRPPQRRRVQPVATPPPQPSARPVAPAVTATRPKPPTVQAPTLRRWLTPTTLRQQFILTELFQPPLSMREERR